MAPCGRLVTITTVNWDLVTGTMSRHPLRWQASRPRKWHVDGGTPWPWARMAHSTHGDVEMMVNWEQATKVGKSFQHGSLVHARSSLSRVATTSPWLSARTALCGRQDTTGMVAWAWATRRTDTSFTRSKACRQSSGRVDGSMDVGQALSARWAHYAHAHGGGGRLRCGH